MSLLGAYKKKSSYDGYESLQLVDSGADSFSGSSGTLAGSIAASLAPKPAPLREDDRSTMDSSGTVTGVCVCKTMADWSESTGAPPGIPSRAHCVSQSRPHLKVLYCMQSRVGHVGFVQQQQKKNPVLQCVLCTDTGLTRRYALGVQRIKKLV